MPVRDHHPFGVLPSLDEMGEITAQMRRAGAAIIEDFKDSLGSEQLAGAVYISMEKQRRIEDTLMPLEDWYGPSSKGSASMSETICLKRLPDNQVIIRPIEPGVLAVGAHVDRGALFLTLVRLADLPQNLTRPEDFVTAVLAAADISAVSQFENCE